MKKTITISTLLFIFVLLSVMLLACGINSESAYAEASPIVRQIGKIDYCGQNFITQSGEFRSFSYTDFRNSLYSALEFILNEERIYPEPDDIRFTNVGEIKNSGEYHTEVTINHDGEVYNSTTVITISKKDLIVRALINGESSCTILEGEEYTTSVEYDGFVNGEDSSFLDAPAVIQTKPKAPTSGYMIVPELCASSNYNIITVGAQIAIKANPDKERRYVEDGVELLVLRGSFSPYCVLEFYDVGLNKTDPRFALINEKIERNFAGNRIFEEYDMANAYVINMYKDDRYAEFSAPLNVRLKIPSAISAKKDYRVIHFFNDGTYEFLSAAETEEGFVTFTTTDLGEFVILTPIEGVSKVVIIAIFIGVIGFVVVLVLLVTIFRKKY